MFIQEYNIWESDWVILFVILWVLKSIIGWWLIYKGYKKLKNKLNKK